MIFDNKMSIEPMIKNASQNSENMEAEAMYKALVRSAMEYDNLQYMVTAVITPTPDRPISIVQ